VLVFAFYKPFLARSLLQLSYHLNLLQRSLPWWQACLSTMEEKNPNGFWDSNFMFGAFPLCALTDNSRAYRHHGG
jgi:hypothetical protein